MPRPRLKRVARIALMLAVVPGSLVLGRWATGNFGTVQPGRVYRSAQLSPGALAATIRRQAIRSVLNLRGPNPDQAWYRGERAATLGAGASQVDIPLASDLWLSRAQARTLVETLDTLDYPVLVHCQWGAERTGLVAAMIELLGPGGSIRSARGQFSAWYLFLPIKDGRVMIGHVDLYERWLAQTSRAHTPSTFRHWLLSVYRPPSPSREEWPHDPYPPRVVTRPTAVGRG